MQTNFTAFQLEDPTVARADSIMRRCVHCGLCTATCPTYLILGDERDSPRGRIYLMKQLFEQGEVTPTITRHIDRCLSCLSCVTTCPSGVDYMHLVDMARARIESKARRPLSQRMMRWFLREVLPYRNRFRFVLALGWFARPFRGAFASLGMTRAASALALVPARVPRIKLRKVKDVIRTDERRVRRVALMLGCVQEVLQPSINRAAIRMLKRHGVDVVLVKEERCCGALSHHLGDEDEALASARHNVDAWTAAMRENPFDAILITASGCGTMVKDYGNLLARDRGYAERAREVSSLARDITEFIEELGMTTPLMWTSIKVAYHSACSLQHGQRVEIEPRALLAQAGFTVVEIPEGHICCGSAGTYNILQPELSGQLRDRKLANIATTAPDVVATGNIGCINQLKAGSPVPVVHTIELLDWATGGPAPAGLKRLESQIHPIQSLVEMASA
ncbi:MAG TPA: glycolate oxidase subunit GlcF [Methyloceanibacter sp.]|nr:glycolate oxidase subunit GlcF [Methyloceanibacter sp.]